MDFDERLQSHAGNGVVELLKISDKEDGRAELAVKKID